MDTAGTQTQEPMAGVELAVRLLGQVELWRDGAAIPAGGPTQRAVLAILALRAGEPVAVESLSDGIWGEAEEPAGALKAMQVHIARLRRVVAHDSTQPIETVSGGYRLDPDGLTIDAPVFERELAAGRQQLADGDAHAAADTLAAALALWRGPALMDLRDFPFAAHVAVRYDELRIDAAEEAVAARLALGESRALVPELQALIAANPYRERLHAQLMTALYRAGQQAAALDAFTAARRRLVLDLGVEPGPELQRLQQQILAQDPVLSGPATAPPSAPMQQPPVASRARSRLPAAPVLFGREALLDELDDMASSERLMTLTGTGGSGKTVLAIALAHRLADRFPNGAAFVDLAAVRRPDQVLPALAAALGVSPQGRSLAEQLAEVLADQRRLVLLDNCEHVLGAVSDLAPLADATAGQFIATSRATLGLKAEHVVPVPPLSLPDDPDCDLSDEPAVHVFRRAATNAGAQLSPDDLPAVAAICRAVDGLPLAIELVAAQTRVEAPAELAATLHERLPALAATARDIPDRQRTMESAIAWSLDRLSQEERRAFSVLAVFAGGFDAHGAARILDRGRAATLGLLAALLDASLLIRQPPGAGRARFRMLEPLRDVASATVDARELMRSRRRHADLMIAEAERLCPAASGCRRPEDFAQLRVEHPNLLAALDYLAGADADACMSLIVDLDPYWYMAAHDREARRMAGELLATGSLSDRNTCLALTYRAAYGGRIRGEPFDLDRTSEMLDRAGRLADHLGDDALTVHVRLAEADLALISGNDEAQLHAVRSAIECARRVKDDGRLVRALMRMPNLDQALLDEALQITDRFPMWRGIVLASLQSWHSTYGADPAMAARWGREALEFAERWDTPVMAALVRGNSGVIAVRMGQLERGQRNLLAALHVLDRSGRRMLSMHPLSGMAELEAVRGRWRNALILHAAAHSIATSIGYEGFARDPEPATEEWMRTAESHIGAAAAAEARAIGEQMTYREAVDFAFEVNGLHPVQTPVPSHIAAAPASRRTQ